MANRPVFLVDEKYPFIKQVDCEFQYYGGFALSQKQKCIQSLHESFKKMYPGKSVLEASSKSPDKLGIDLSAFRMKYPEKGKSYILENVFQSSKVFENGGPYRDLLLCEPRDAKRDPRLKESGIIMAFNLFGEVFPKDPKDLFYNWIYIKTLYENHTLSHELLQYDAFTDIEFNPKKSINCQAKACTVFVGLARSGLLDEAVRTKEDFARTVYHVNIEDGKDAFEQLSFF